MSDNVHEDEKLACYGAVSAACADIASTNTLLGPFTVDRDAKLLMAEMIYNKMCEAGSDLEAFAGHAKRSNINVDDVKLLFRRNNSIVEMIQQIDQEDQPERGQKRKREPENTKTTSGA